MIPPIEKWEPMLTAPREGECVVVVYREYNRPGGRLRIATAQWLCNEAGEEWGWRIPFRPGSTQYADGWLPHAELIALQDAAKKIDTPEFDL